MITELQQDQAARFALGDLSPAEERDFAAQARANPELRDYLHGLQKSVDALALAAPLVPPPPGLKGKVMDRVRAGTQSGTPGGKPTGDGGVRDLRFLLGGEGQWKPLPIPGAFIRLLSLEADRGYAVLMGKLEPGTRYPAHINAGPEDFYILTGDLHVSGQVLRAGDFHHADGGSAHGENFSVDGCTLLAVLTTDDPLVQFAMT